LYLRLAGQSGGEDSSTKALELEAHNRHTGDKPINVAFLSGSQRFRVAVSLALGIGQYASRQHRPLESVIIDEGFGCLDRFGRQLMIQELHNLRGHLRCILLVSHQDEFADAFADGYRFELTNGTTVATRFQR
jgi:exonuclease SbcC